MGVWITSILIRTFLERSDKGVGTEQAETFCALPRSMIMTSNNTGKSVTVLGHLCSILIVTNAWYTLEIKSQRVGRYPKQRVVFLKCDVRMFERERDFHCMTHLLTNSSNTPGTQPTTPVLKHDTIWCVRTIQFR